MLGSVVGLVATSWAAPAHAAPFELAWSAPEGCPSREAIVEATQARLGKAPSGASAKLFVQGTVIAEGRGFTVTLDLKDGAGRPIGERAIRVERPSCNDIQDPTSVVLAMMIGVAAPHLEEHDGSGTDVESGTERASGTERGSRAEPESTPPAPSAADPPPAAPRPRAKQAAARSIALRPLEHRVLLAAMGVTSLGILDTVGLGAALRATYSPTSPLVFALETGIEASPARLVAGGEVAFQLISASLRVGLAVLRTGNIELIPTAGARGALIRTSPTGFATVQNEVRTTMAVGPGLLVRARLGAHLFAEVLPEVEGLLRRDHFKIRDGGELYDVHRPAAFDGRLSVGLAYELR